MFEILDKLNDDWTHRSSGYKFVWRTVRLPVVQIMFLFFCASLLSLFLHRNRRFAQSCRVHTVRRFARSVGCMMRSLINSLGPTYGKCAYRQWRRVQGPNDVRPFVRSVIIDCSRWNFGSQRRAFHHLPLSLWTAWPALCASWQSIYRRLLSIITDCRTLQVDCRLLRL